MTSYEDRIIRILGSLQRTVQLRTNSKEFTETLQEVEDNLMAVIKTLETLRGEK